MSQDVLGGAAPASIPAPLPDLPPGWGWAWSPLLLGSRPGLETGNKPGSSLRLPV